MRNLIPRFLPAALLAAALPAGAVTIDFEDLPVGSLLSNQYAGLGVSFTPNAFTGPGSSTSGESWASNTDMTIVDINGTDVDSPLTPTLASGNVLRSLSGWLLEDGDASFRVSFAAPVNFFSAVFVSVGPSAALVGDVTMWAYNGATLVGTVSADRTGQLLLSLQAPAITSVVIRPGSYNDWVGVDDISFTPAAAVPEPGAAWLLALGLPLVLAGRRARR